jgi:sulfur carrier protein
MSIKITLNGESAEISEGITVKKLLEERNIKSELVTVEHNGTILHKEEYDKIVLSSGDTVEFLYYMGGGIQ